MVGTGQNNIFQSFRTVLSHLVPPDPKDPAPVRAKEVNETFWADFSSIEPASMKGPSLLVGNPGIVSADTFPVRASVVWPDPEVRLILAVTFVVPMLFRFREAEKVPWKEMA